MYGSKTTMMMVHDKKRTLHYNSFCNGEVLLLLAESGVHTPDRRFIIKVARFIS